VFITGAKMCYNTLKFSKIRYVFGSPGTTELSVLREITNDPEMQYFFVLHESVAVGMADGFARASGHLGVANLHATQGTLNAAGFIRIAQRDNSPILLIAGAPSTEYAFNEPNHFAYGISYMVRNITKWSWIVQSTKQIPTIINRAINIALSKPKGPAYVAIPQDFLLKKARIKSLNGIWKGVNEVISEGNNQGIKRAAQLLLSSHTPLIFAGNGVGRSNAVDELVKIAEFLGSPVISEALDRGSMLHSVNFLGNHPLFLGYFDKRNSIMRHFINKCDVLLEIGTKSTYPRVIGPLNPLTKVIQIDNSSWEMAKNHSIELGIVGDIKTVLERISQILESEATTSDAEKCKQRSLTIMALTESRKHDLDNVRLTGKPITPKQLVKALREALDEEVIIVDDSQSFGYYMKTYYEFKKPGTLYGSMASHLGWALPASLGVKLAKPHHKVICLISDASLVFSIQSLHAASQYRIPVAIIVCNNHGFMSLKLELLSGETHCKTNVLDTSDSKMNLSKIAKNFGLESTSIADANEIIVAVRKAISSDQPTLLEINMSNNISDWADSWYVPYEDIIKM
jgi:benzoylformate decarboxylase